MAESTHAATIQIMELFCIQKAEEADTKGDKKAAERWYMKAATYGRHDATPRKKLSKGTVKQ